MTDVRSLIQVELRSSSFEIRNQPGLLLASNVCDQMGKRILVVCAFIGCAACARQDTKLEQHQKALQSLRSTTTAIAGAWLDGKISGTYTRTALERTFQLIEQERATLAASPRMLSDPRGAQLSQAAEHMSRVVALMVNDVTTASGPSMRQRVAEISRTD